MTEPNKSSATVTVALKHPHGLVLRLYDMVEVNEPVMGGGSRLVKVARYNGKQVILKGYSPKGSSVPLPAVDSSFALTSGVPKDFWDAWLAQNRDHPFVVNGIIFASTDSKYVGDKSREREELRCGMEPLNPSKLPVSGIQTYDRAAG